MGKSSRRWVSVPPDSGRCIIKSSQAEVSSNVARKQSMSPVSARKHWNGSWPKSMNRLKSSNGHIGSLIGLRTKSGNGIISSCYRHHQKRYSTDICASIPGRQHPTPRETGRAPSQTVAAAARLVVAQSDCNSRPLAIPGAVEPDSHYSLSAAERSPCVYYTQACLSGLALSCEPFAEPDGSLVVCFFPSCNDDG
jgi:hypothetical protein